MSELNSYYEAFRTGYWADPEEAHCPCHGSGWALSQVDTWHECPRHYQGQRHPEDERYEEEAPQLQEVPVVQPVILPPSTLFPDDDIPF